MRFLAVVIGVLLTACANSSLDLPAAAGSSSNEASPPVPFHATLVIVHNSCGDSDEALVEFFPDGKPGDPSGVSATAVWDEEIAKAILNGSPPGTGWESEDVKEGHWEHDLVRADGTRPSVPPDLRSYRIHDGDSDAWRWVTDSCGAP